MIAPEWVATASIVYVVVLLLLGVAGRRARRAATLREHYLAGGTLGFVVLLLTLFATQYSGNSLSGFPGKTYRAGLAYAMSITFMVGIVAGYLLFAPALVRIARRHSFLTPTDFLRERFRSPTLEVVSIAIFLVTLGNFLLAQLMALGHGVAGLTDQRIPYAAGVIGGAAVILIYEWLGGMRAVAWTDVLQGGILAIGLAFVVTLIVVEVGTPAAIVATVQARAPSKIDNPSWQVCLTWLSNFLLLGLGGPLYPQAIQRLYAARDSRTLRRALAVMAVVPLFAITTVVFIGLTGLALFPDLDAIESDQVTFRVLGHLVTQEPLATIPVLLVMMAVLAAIMSTADSSLLSMVSIVTKDVIARVRRLSDGASDRLTHSAPVISLAILAILVLIALRPRLTLWRLLEIKFEILIQLSPAFVLGTRRPQGDPKAVDARDVLTGIAVGLGIALGLYLSGHRSFYGLHPGAIGVGANYLTVLGSHALRGRSAKLPA